MSTHYVSNYTSGACDLCNVGIVNCTVCNEDSTKANNISCMHCVSGYHTPVGQTSCVACSVTITNCNNCTETLSNTTTVSGQECTNCDTPYYAVANGTCVSCNDSTYNCAGCE